MNTITSKDQKYYDIIKIKSKDIYSINCNLMDINEEIVCPYDKDMKVGKNESGQIVLKKSSHLNPFLK